ncbi:probable isoaspartyl peptidase/L-asparaginase GA20639 isoform X2 [Macrosteles quadrilineatus]|nr:probable isoaspartyl peptidase/L-asparaginase GA20639 isoform X2 [Macrosteles quadrilineatus]XP_054261833.1 probable isoaspartyl peptidase/L-asparaginase GA20639 isoform X2 [Macrosteles quadrilineatus]XP_054261834.1 probable isoaspartyl peptidase/L-asparaginase GA20639 isoform X2 [Macrosteles quadrilineatus]XP_054261835.1 probable isoaspartyl peptidase/L-asparaginase GA20639 isoform X2 [Macrosteles quadrilineatus]XP_054261836.1 probable isoaspartyl peptidase/L-asparaginase GA20639 isoform X2
MAHKSFQPIVLVHGGAGDIPDSRVSAKLDGVCRAARKGYEILQKTGSVLDGIVAAVELMEDEPAFNAGKGSVLTLEGNIEMEALICEGKNLKSGAVTLVKNIAHPISLARRVMVETPHAFLGGEAVNEFAARMGVPTVPDDYLFTSAAQAALDHFKQAKSIPSKMEIGEVGVGTVGSVAIDAAGHMASATSTGGITGKYNGRIGDTPLLGCGGYADDERGTVSTTGHGETIMRYNLAQRILADIASGKSAQEGTKDQCEGMTKRLNNTGGAITISSRGEVGVFFTSKRMAWAYQLGDELHYGIEHGQHLVDKV